MIEHKDFPVGTEVGARRWPYSSAHPDVWKTALKGRVVPLDDPEAWYDTLAFPCLDGRLPSQEAVTAHVADPNVRRLLDALVPVRWEGCGIRWERLEGPNVLRPYEDDLTAWHQVRDAARRQESVVV